MGLEFPLPLSTGEWLGWTSAVITIIFGLMLLVLPKTSLRMLRLRTADDHPEAVSEARGTMAGFYLGVGLACILLAQPMLYLALGAGWAFTALGRLVSMVADRGMTAFNLVSIVIEAALAALPLAYALGYVA